MQEFADEIRKLKAMIVKHENRIRALEAERAIEKSSNLDGSSAAAGDALNDVSEAIAAAATIAGDEV